MVKLCYGNSEIDTRLGKESMDGRLYNHSYQAVAVKGEEGM